MRLLPIAAALGMAFAVSTAQAASIDYEYEISSAVTPINSSFTVDLFDAAGLNATLTSVKFTLSGVTTGTVEVENRSGAAATITTTFSATLTLTRPSGGATIVVTTPTKTIIDELLAYDNDNDGDGDSGETHTDVTANASHSETLTNGADLLLFTGNGSIILPFLAVGSSSAQGSGNISTTFSNFASANLKIEYFYTPIVTVPEPLSLSLLGAGLLGLGVVRARRKA